LFEERLTSFEARQINASALSRKKNKFVDDIAASLILQHFLDDLQVR
jgi:RNase H-fold protein (predicted Holliday junction resolvase)